MIYILRVPDYRFFMLIINFLENGSDFCCFRCFFKHFRINCCYWPMCNIYTKKTNLLAVVFCLHIVTDVCNRINNAFWYRYLFDVLQNCWFWKFCNKLNEICWNNHISQWFKCYGLSAVVFEHFSWFTFGIVICFKRVLKYEMQMIVQNSNCTHFFL